jgi:HSP20 family protein
MMTCLKYLLILFSLISFTLFSPAYAAVNKASPKKIHDESKNKQTDDAILPGFDELMDHDWSDLLNSRFSNNFPRMNIQESKDSYHIEAELPGVKKEEVEIKLKDDYLVISGEKKSIKEEVKNQYRRIERSNGSFYRAVSIPKDIDKDKITAELKDGILNIDIGKTKAIHETMEKKILIK